MRNKIFLLLLLVFPLTLLAQEKKKISSFSKSKGEDDVYSLLNRAERMAGKDPKGALNYVEQALSMSLREGDKEGEALSYATLGKINYRQGLYAQSIDSYNKALKLFQEQKNSSRILETKRNLAEAYESNRELDKALELYQSALKETKSNTEETIAIKNRIGGVYEKQGKYDEALKIYKEILNVQEQRGNKEGIIAANNSIGNIYLHQEKTQQAREYYEKSNEVAIQSSDTTKIAESFDKIGNTLRKEGKFKDEVVIRQQALEVNQTMNNKEALAEDYLNIGKAYNEQKKLEEALSYLEKSATLSKKLGKLDKLAEAEEALSNTYKLQNDYRNALEHYRLHVQAKDSLLAQRESELANMISFNDELTLRQKKIDLLEKDMKLNEQTILLLQEEKNFSQLLVYMLSTGLVIVFGGSWMVYNSSRKRRIANQKLALRSLRSQMNPHFIFNALNSVNNYISKNDERSANKYLSDFSKLMRTVMENSQHEFISLSTEISILQLYLSLEQSRFREKFDYELNVSDEINPDQLEVPPMLIQPYIENAVWHGLRYRDDKGFLKVTISQEENNLKVLVEDNGIGRKKSMELKTANQRANVSTGLKNTESRLKILNELYSTRMQVTMEDLYPETESGTKVTILITGSKKMKA